MPSRPASHTRRLFIVFIHRHHNVPWRVAEVPNTTLRSRSTDLIPTISGRRIALLGNLMSVT